VTGDVIKEFLVSLGFEIDKKSFSDFNQGLISATKRVGALYAAMTAAGVGIFYGISKAAGSVEELGYQLRLIAPSINRMMYLRQELLKAYSAAGVDLRKAAQQAIMFNLAMEKTKYALKAIYVSVASKFFPLLTQQMDLFRKKIYDNMPKIQRFFEKFVKIMFQAFDALILFGTRVWSILGRIWDFFAKLHEATSGWSTVIMGLVVAWQALNLAFLASPLGMIFAGLVAIIALYDDFKTFQEGGESFFDWSGVIVALAKVKDGFDQVMMTLEAFMPLINLVIESVKTLVTTFASLFMKMDVLDSFLATWQGFRHTIEGIIDVIGNLVLAFQSLIRGDFLAFFENLRGVLRGILEIVGGIVQMVGSLVEAALKLGVIGLNSIASVFGAGQVDVNRSGSLFSDKPALNPNVAAPTTNQNLNAQTNITVLGSADAQATGKAVANQQNAVNRSTVRNFRTVAQ